MPGIYPGEKSEPCLGPPAVSVLTTHANTSGHDLNDRIPNDRAQKKAGNETEASIMYKRAEKVQRRTVVPLLL